MANQTATLLNKDASRATALKLYTGEVIKAFRQKNVARDTIKSRTISGGKTAQFIVTGKASEADIQTHVRGDEVVSHVMANDEVTISVSDRLVHAHFIDDLDETLAQYESRGELSFQSGEVLATDLDRKVFKLVGNDVAAMAPLTGQSAATTIVATGYNAAGNAQDKGDIIIASLFEAKSALNKKDVTDEPSIFVSAEDYYNIVQSTRGVNSDYTTGNGGIDTGSVRSIAGFNKLGWTNHLDTVTNADLLGLVYTKDVAGLVVAMDVKSEANYDPRRLGTLLTSFYAIGMGALNPTGLVVINKG